MIKKAVFENDLILGMQRELQAHDKKQAMASLDQAGQYLHSALEILEEVGLTAQADKVLSILRKIANEHKKEEPKKEHEPHKADCDHYYLVRKGGKCHSCGKTFKPNFGDFLADDNADFDGDKPDHSKEDQSRYDNDDARGKPPHPKNPTKVHDPHIPKSTEQAVRGLKEYGIPFVNLSDDGKADTLLEVEYSDNNNLEVTEDPAEKTFEDES